MAKKDIVVHLDLFQQQILNAALQVLTSFPSSPVLGQVVYISPRKSAFIWTGDTTNVGIPDNPGWLDLGQVYSHPTFTLTGPGVTSALTGAQVISQITLTNGHITGISTRNLTAADIGASSSTHVHNFADIIGLPANTILGNNTTGTGAAKAMTVAELLSMLGIINGTLTLLNTGTNTTQATWTAKDLNDWLTSKLATYVTVVNLALGTRTATTMPISNSAGSGVNLVEATQALAGLMTAADKTKLDGIAVGANAYVHPTQNPGAHPFATAIASGLQVLSQMTVTNEGHVTAIAARTLTAADIASVMINDAINNGTNTTWSSTKIYNELQSAISQAQTGALTYKGNYDPTTNTPNITSNTAVKTGWTYVVSVGGVFAGQPVEPGDMIIAKVDNPGTSASNYQIVNKNIPAIVSASTTVEGIIYLATVAEVVAGTNNNKAISPSTLRAVLNTRLANFYTVFGNGSGTSFTFPHLLGTDRIMVQIRRVSDKREVILDWAANDTNILLNMNVAPATGEYELLVTKI